MTENDNPYLTKVPYTLGVVFGVLTLIDFFGRWLIPPFFLSVLTVVFNSYFFVAERRLKRGLKIFSFVVNTLLLFSFSFIYFTIPQIDMAICWLLVALLLPALAISMVKKRIL